jgi:cation:H+ antiporter
MPTGFSLLIAAQFTSALADNALLIVTMALLQEQGVPGWWAPLLKFAFTLSYVVLAPVAGPLADAMPKARLMAWMNAIKVLGVLGLLVGVHPVLAYAVVGFALWRNRSRLGRGDYLLRVDHRRLAGDQLAFLLVFALKVVLGLVAFAIKPWLGVLFLAAYAAYVWREIRSADTAPEEEELDALKLRAGGGLGWAAAQASLALVVIAAAAHGFVAQLETLAGHWGMAPHLVALLLSPVATELPEIMNALIWLRQGKERLALANISGAMMIQATIPSAFGLFFTPWLFDSVLLWSGLATMAAIVGLWLLFRRGNVDGRWLLGAGAVYLLFAGCLV